MQYCIILFYRLSFRCLYSYFFSCLNLFQVFVFIYIICIIFTYAYLFFFFLMTTVSYIDIILLVSLMYICWLGFFFIFFSFCCQKKAIVTNLQMVHRFFLACVQSEEKFLEMELSDQIEYQYYFSNCQVTIHSFTTLRQTTAWFLDVYFFILS